MNTNTRKETENHNSKTGPIVVLPWNGIHVITDDFAFVKGSCSTKLSCYSLTTLTWHSWKKHKRLHGM